MLIACKFIPSAPRTFTRELRARTHFSLAEILVQAGTAGAGGMAPPISTRISARMKRVGNTVHA